MSRIQQIYADKSHQDPMSRFKNDDYYLMLWSPFLWHKANLNVRSHWLEYKKHMRSNMVYSWSNTVEYGQTHSYLHQQFFDSVDLRICFYLFKLFKNQRKTKDYLENDANLNRVQTIWYHHLSYPFLFLSKNFGHLQDLRCYKNLNHLKKRKWNVLNNRMKGYPVCKEQKA